ncbi:30S ribosomal protein S16 [Nakamurella sp. DB0629]|uniref:Small ribosomal subunit protein bS16 n=1 Tax=Nakamurella aerolata TaxID=1656892 RepID=A0A849A4M8_9ACTN|nr:30S ribosomal protein S16 [Nakamurella aerolata]
MAVKIKLARYGKIRTPYYRVVVADSRTRRSGRAIETIGRYNPKTDPSVIEVESERVQYWLGVGAQPTAAVEALLKVTGDWQKFKGLPGAEGTLQPQPERPDKKALYEAAVKAAGGTIEDTSGATTPKKKADSKAEAKAEAKADKPARVVAETESGADALNEVAADAADGVDDGPNDAAIAKAVDGEEAPFGAGSHAPIADDAQPEGFPIKGNASSKLYHRPGTQFYDSTVAEVWFADEAAAEAAGFSLPKSQQSDSTDESADS